MPALSPTRQNALLLVLLLFAQLLLMAGSARGDRGTTLLELGVMRATRPVAATASAAAGTLRGAVQDLRELLHARSENERLREEVHRLQTELKRSREHSLQNERLRRLLGMRENLAPQAIAAEVITASLTGQTMMIKVNRGTADGVHADLPVVAWGGVVGRVVTADRQLAKVRLLIDPNSGVAGIVQRSRVEGMVLGQGDDPLEMLYVPKFSDVAFGDRVVTSGLDGVFPRGLGIGRVSSVRQESSFSTGIELRPEVDFAALEEVLVLLEPVGSPLLESSGSGEGR